MMHSRMNAHVQALATQSETLALQLDQQVRQMAFEPYFQSIYNYAQVLDKQSQERAKTQRQNHQQSQTRSGSGRSTAGGRGDQNRGGGRSAGRGDGRGGRGGCGGRGERTGN